MFLVGSIIITQYITSIGLFYKNLGRLWRVCLTCEELSGGYLEIV